MEQNKPQTYSECIQLIDISIQVNFVFLTDFVWQNYIILLYYFQFISSFSLTE